LDRPGKICIVSVEISANGYPSDARGKNLEKNPSDAHALDQGFPTVL